MKLLLDECVVYDLKRDLADHQVVTTPYRREPIAIKGKPLSETVIEERR